MTEAEGWAAIEAGGYLKRTWDRSARMWLIPVFTSIDDAFRFWRGPDRKGAWAVRHIHIANACEEERAPATAEDQAIAEANRVTARRHAEAVREFHEARDRAASEPKPKGQNDERRDKRTAEGH
jgi:hypothetical protein